MVAKRKSRTLGHAAQNTALRLFPFCGNNALVTAQGEHGRHTHHARHEQVDRLRGKTAHDGTAEQRASGIGDIAVEHHETVHAGTALGGRLGIGNACVQVLIKPPASPKTHAANTSPGTDSGANPTPSDSTAVITHVTNDVRRGPKRSMTDPDTILPTDVIRLRTSVMAAPKRPCRPDHTWPHR